MTKKELAFVAIVKTYYKKHGRHELAWRKTTDPYRILVSEVMLQQTQVERVVPKYQAFLKVFPTIQILAKAPLGEVLVIWQGLGYNRRAKMLHLCAQQIVTTHKDRFPKSEQELIALPGIGSYTARAILAFAYNQALPLIETNVRSVYIHHFFKNTEDVSDTDLVRYIVRTLDMENPREWYYALMDYGSYLKKVHGNPNTKSANYSKQSAFQGSDRQIRGAIIRLLTTQHTCTRKKMLQELSSFEDIRVDAQTQKLLVEGMIVYKAKKYSLPAR